MAGLRTGEVAAAAGVNLQTLRYYERRGLLAEPERTLGGHRVYPEQTVTVLRVIKAAQRLGFTLEEVAELLDSGATTTASHPTRVCMSGPRSSWPRSRPGSPTCR
jgi:MerR family transcriptional regulator, mercuric resistance operon regulatory protein